MDNNVFKDIRGIACEGLIEKEAVVEYKKNFSCNKKISRAELSVTAYGVYVARVNGEIVSYPLAPGYDSYPYRIQYQTYDITDKLGDENTVSIVVGRGWCGFYDWNDLIGLLSSSRTMIAKITVFYEDGSIDSICTDSTWSGSLGKTVSSDIFNGEAYNAAMEQFESLPLKTVDLSERNIVSQDGEEICEVEVIKPVSMFITPKGEKVIDFGQNLTGYIEFELDANAGDVIEISHAEVLDKDNNFYTVNYRTAKAKIKYICKEGKQKYKPQLTFFGFRYIRIDKAPNAVCKDNFKAIVVHSDMKRTGFLKSSDLLLNKLFDNIIWGQKGNFLDVPTDCPQRDERKGWTGDAQVFCKTAMYNFDCEKFFVRWLKNVREEQNALGFVPGVVPNDWRKDYCSSAWGDVATVCPWELYLTYGNKELLRQHYPLMKKHVDFITSVTEEQFLWKGGKHFGDWLGLDAPSGSYTGSSDKTLIATAFYAYSVSLLVKAGKALGEDVYEYEQLYRSIKKKFNDTFKEFNTQTECILALHFNLPDSKEATVKKLVELIRNCGNHLQTGFVGTPYLLHALSENGEEELAYELLCREEYPSWLYSVKNGATTIWEYWDGVNDNGEFWSPDMNSFNHYAYGCVADWVYSVALGINAELPGYEKAKITPHPTDRIDELEGTFITRHGVIKSRWYHRNKKVCYEIEVPVPATVVIDNKEYEVQAGRYEF